MRFEPVLVFLNYSRIQCHLDGTVTDLKRFMVPVLMLTLRSNHGGDQLNKTKGKPYIFR